MSEVILIQVKDESRNSEFIYFFFTVQIFWSRSIFLAQLLNFGQIPFITLTPATSLTPCPLNFGVSRS